MIVTRLWTLFPLVIIRKYTKRLSLIKVRWKQCILHRQPLKRYGLWPFPNNPKNQESYIQFKFILKTTKNAQKNSHIHLPFVCFSYGVKSNVTLIMQYILLSISENTCCFNIQQNGYCPMGDNLMNFPRQNCLPGALIRIVSLWP